jgi:hypothetical protein
MYDMTEEIKPLRSERLAARGYVYSSARARLSSPGLKFLALLQGLAILVFA